LRKNRKLIKVNLDDGKREHVEVGTALMRPLFLLLLLLADRYEEQSSI
jgi:hypothetical protein